MNHDVLMERLSRRIADRRVLRLIRRYLMAGVMADGVVVERHEGTPQGGPLSPLLANVLLDEVDQELERRGLVFARYADDLNVYTGSKRAADDAMVTLKRLFARLRLQVNEAKSTVARAWERKFLGYSFWIAPGRMVRFRVAPAALAEMKARVRQITSRTGGRSMTRIAEELRSYLTGWKLYFQLAETPNIFREIDKWLHHRLRAVQLKQWKRGTTTYRALRARGLSDKVAREGRPTSAAGGRPHCTQPSPPLCLSHTSTGSAFPASPVVEPSNRRMRTRMSGGVGGIAGRTRYPYPD